MSYGLLVKNSSNYVQIDQDYANCTLIASGSVSVTASTTSAVNPATISFAAQSSPVIVCIGATGSAFVAVYTRTSSSVQFVSSATISLPYRIYASVANNPGTLTDYGLVVKNASGQVTFNSNLPYMRIGQQTTSIVGYSSMPTVYHSFGSAFVDITNTGARAFLTIATAPGEPSFATGFGIKVGSGFYQYGQVVIWAAPGLIASGYYTSPNGTQQAMVLSA